MWKKQRPLFFSLSVIGLFLLSSVLVFAANTTSVLGGGVTINEVLPDPNGSTYNTDTDGNGIAADTDEFVELYNLSATAIDISGWELWDAGTGKWFTFPGTPGSNTTVLASGAYAHVMCGVQPGGSLPTMTNPNSIAFDAGRGSAVINNSSDNVVLYDPVNDQYIQLTFNGDTPDDPPNDYNGFSNTASRVGSIEDWGNDLDGVSLTRSPSGDANIVQHQSVYGRTASPNAIQFAGMRASSGPSPVLFAIWLLGFIALLGGGFWLRRLSARTHHAKASNIIKEEA